MYQITRNLLIGIFAFASLSQANIQAEEKQPATKVAARHIGLGPELFVDDWLIEQMKGTRLVLNRPTPREVAIRFNAPWEGIDSAYVTVFKDGDRYRMYYRGNPDGHPEITCYAESKDGIAWTKPNLGLFPFKGSKDNNIVWSGPGTHNFTPFKDDNPKASPEQRYKAVGGGPLVAFVSADGIRWKLLQKEPIIKKGAFDSQNLVFWDSKCRCYAAYYRGFLKGVRGIMTCTSADFRTWTEPVFLDYGKVPMEHFYTNAIAPYFGAPHIYLGFPMRFVPNRTVVTEQPHGGVSDGVFMTSRDGLHWDRRFREAFVRPGLDRLNWMHRSNMAAWGILPTGPAEISLYYSEHYNTPKNQLRRYALRMDGFASVRASAEGGEMLTRPFTFKGHLILNYSTSAAGSIRVEVQAADGKPLPGFSLADCEEIYGDNIGQSVSWKGGDLDRRAEQPIRLRFVMMDADLYAISFR